MVQQIVNIPEQDMSLFLELAKKMKWKVGELPSPTIDIVLSAEQLAILEERAKTPKEDYISKENFFKYIDAL